MTLCKVVGRTSAHVQPTGAGVFFVDFARCGFEEETGLLEEASFLWREDCSEDCFEDSFEEDSFFPVFASGGLVPRCVLCDSGFEDAWWLECSECPLEVLEWMECDEDAFAWLEALTLDDLPLASCDECLECEDACPDGSSRVFAGSTSSTVASNPSSKCASSRSSISAGLSFASRFCAQAALRMPPVPAIAFLTSTSSRAARAFGSPVVRYASAFCASEEASSFSSSFSSTATTPGSCALVQASLAFAVSCCHASSLSSALFALPPRASST